MSQEGVNPAVAAKQSNIAQELMEEDLNREIARNEAATKMAMEREVQAVQARKRAQESQVCMSAMLEKYEQMKNKLDCTKKNLDDTTSKISVQQQLTEKIVAMKERIEVYATKKEAVSYLTEHVNLKHELNSNKLESVKEDMELSEPEGKTDEESERYKRTKAGLTDYTERVEALRISMKQNEESLQKRELIKAQLEKQVLIGEKRASEQTRITVAREKLLELKMKELQLQKAKLARRKLEQEEKERATDDFFAQIDKQLEDMEATAQNAPPPTTDAVTKQEVTDQNAAPPTTDAVTKQEVTDQNLPPPTADAVTKQEVTDQNKPPPTTGAVPKQKRNKSKGKGRNRSKSNTPKVMSPEPLTQSKAKTPKVMSPEPKAVEIKEESPKPNVHTPKAMLPKPVKKEYQTEEKNNVEKIETEEKSESTPKSVKPMMDGNSEPTQNYIEADKKLEEQAGETEKELTAENISEEKEKSSFTEDQISTDLEEKSREGKMTEEEVKEMVEKVEGKCQNIRGDIADMAMSEQYLRTKQALLMAKKKEQEMKIATKMAEIREAEVQKMKEKVQHMQDLLVQRKEKLQITEELMAEKDGEKKHIDKQIEATKRRENYVENAIMETVMFEKPPKKK